MNELLRHVKGAEYGGRSTIEGENDPNRGNRGNGEDRIVRRELFFFTNKANKLTKSIIPEVGWAKDWSMPHSTTK